MNGELWGHGELANYGVTNYNSQKGVKPSKFDL
jgi:hypothetical protein